jgi:hypothetical protein
MPYATHSRIVTAPKDRLWAILLEKIENPAIDLPGVESCEIVEREGDRLTRRTVTLARTVTERVAIDRARHRITYTMLDHPLYLGYIEHRLDDPEDGEGVTVTLTVDLTPRTEADDVDGGEMLPVLEAAVHDLEARARAGANGA